ncbi:MAG: PilZ domain-containing protein [Parvularculaceae bacterium]
MDTESEGSRKSFRFALTASVDVVEGQERAAFGTLIDLSRDGCAIRSLTPLNIGRNYTFHIRGLGTWNGKIVRRFDGRNYGVMFENSESQKRHIDRLLTEILEGKINAYDLLPQRPKIRAF